MTDVLVLTEHRRGELRDVSLELANAGSTLSEETGGELHVAVIGGDVETFGDLMNREGVDVIHTIDEGEEFNHDIYVQVAEQLVDELDPIVTLIPHTVNGMDYAPVLAERLDQPVVTDTIELTYDGGLTVVREMYGSKVETEITVDGEQSVVTIRPAEWSLVDQRGDADVQSFDATIDESAIGTTVTGFEKSTDSDVDITEADILVSIGRGINEEENLDLIFDLAKAMGATVSASRPIVDNGWLDPGRQVGQSGKIVTPDVYIAIGISGAVQHVAGMKDSDVIVAINEDPNAPIFDIADYGIVDDLFEIVPELIAEFK